MNCRGALLVLAVLSVGCGRDAPPACQVIAPLSDGGAEPAGDAGVVWGFADLHAHPAVEVAFGGRLIWGAAIDDLPVNASELPMIQACPVETHDRNAASPLDHKVGSIAFPLVAHVASFAHAPVGDLTFRTSNAWPNARDVIHQQMNVSSIRRAYEGGLRLMFASTTDDQMVAALLGGPSFVNAFVPDPSADFYSARLQLELIESVVEQNESWMGVARSPKDARALIGAGKLAIVMSVEMGGLTQDQLDTLVTDYGLRHVLPIHLIDNDVGGTAANGDIFNTSSAETSEIYRKDKKPLGYMDVAPSVDFSRGLGWPLQIVSFAPPVYVNVEPIPYPSYASYCYEALPFCNGGASTATSFLQLGQVNFRGLCTTRDECASGNRPGAARIAHMMRSGLFVDVSHMSHRSVADTLRVTPDMTSDPGAGGCDPPTPPMPSSPPTYPLIASHGDVAHLCDSQTASPNCRDSTTPSDALTPSAVTERSLDADQARAIVGRHGVLGLGTGVGTYLAKRVYEARGGPLLSFDLAEGHAAACTAVPPADGSTRPCAPPVQRVVADAGAAVAADTIEIRTRGAYSLGPGNPRDARPVARVELLGSSGSRYQRRIIEMPLDCSSQACEASFPLYGQPPPLQLQEQCDGAEVATTTSDAPAAVTLCAPPPVPDGGSAYTIDHIEQVSVELRNVLGGDFECQEPSSDTTDKAPAPEWTIQTATVVVGGDAGTLATMGQTEGPPVARIDTLRGSFSLYQREDRSDIYDYVPASGRLLRVTLVSGAENVLSGATTASPGANVCVAVRQLVDGACKATEPPSAGEEECPSGWVAVNQRGEWATGTSLYTFVKFQEDPGPICGVDVAVLDAARPSPPWSIDEVRVDAIEDPVAHFVRRYADISREVAGGHMGTVAFGTDFNGLNGMLDISEKPVPPGAVAPSACLLTGPATGSDAGAHPPQPLEPMRLRHADGTLGGEVLIDERGLATYGLLADMMAIVHDEPACGGDVYDSLMLSAEATIRAWEVMTGFPARDPLPTRPFCPDGGLDP